MNEARATVKIIESEEAHLRNVLQLAESDSIAKIAAIRLNARIEERQKFERKTEGTAGKYEEGAE